MLQQRLPNLTRQVVECPSVEVVSGNMAGSTIRLLSSEYHFRETVVLAQSCAADQAHLRSHSGPCASLVLCGSPTSPEFTVKPHLFRTIILERLRLPLLITDARSWMPEDNTERPVPDPADCDPELSQQSAPPSLPGGRRHSEVQR